MGEKEKEPKPAAKKEETAPTAKKEEPTPSANKEEHAINEDFGKEQIGNLPTPPISTSEEKGEERKDRARETIAFILVFGLLALFFASFLFAGTVDDAIKLIQAISSALTGLIGAVLGYYFGSSGVKQAGSEKPVEGKK